MKQDISRRSFIRASALGAAAMGLSAQKLIASAQDNIIQGFEDHGNLLDDRHAGWVPFSDRKIKVGLAGYGLCHFGTQFEFQHHPNVEVVAVTDLIPERCINMAYEVGCKKTYPSFEDMVKDPEIEAVFIATDAPSHFRHAMLALEHGKHVASAVPAVYGSVEDAHKLFQKVKQTGLTYMMFETSMFHEDLYAMRKLYQADRLGQVIYAEGEYYHFMPVPLDSFNGWRIGLPPMWYPTHANAYYVGVTGNSFTEVSCMGVKSKYNTMKGDNRYKNPFGTEIALYRTSDGGTARMGISWDTPGYGGEMGRIRCQKGCFYGHFDTEEPFSADISDVDTKRPPLPAAVGVGGHGGSHGSLTDEFIHAIIENRKPLVDVGTALNMTVAGIVAHKSAMKDGELLKIPQFKF